MKALRGSLFLLVVSSALIAACSDSPSSTTDAGATGHGGTGGRGGTGGSVAGSNGSTAGTGAAGSTAGTGAAGSTAGTGAAGSTAGTGAAGSTGGAGGAKDGGTDADAATDAVDAPKDMAGDTAGDAKDAATDAVDAPKDTVVTDAPTDGGVGALASKAVVTIAHTAATATMAGTATFTDVAGIVTLVISVTGCPQGAHGFHLHTNASCGNDAADAGGHWTPKGDTNLGTLTCAADGTGTVTYVTPSAGYWTIGGSAETNVLPHALVIHGSADADGGTASRIACGLPAARAVATIAHTGTNTIAGTGTFTTTAAGTTLVIAVTGCPVGVHPWHLHTNASCGNDAADAGGHWTPKGDTGLPTLTCAADGTGTVTYTTATAAYWTVGGLADSDILPHALVIHATADSDGGAATRIGCGVPK